MEAGSSLRKVGIVVAWLGVAVYVSSFTQWCFMLILKIRVQPNGPWAEFFNVLPCVLLLAIFITAALQRCNARRHWSLLMLALITMVVWSSYDYTHANYQIGEHSDDRGWDQYHVLGEGATHHYINWPWLALFD